MDSAEVWPAIAAVAVGVFWALTLLLYGPVTGVDAARRLPAAVALVGTSLSTAIMVVAMLVTM